MPSRSPDHLARRPPSASLLLTTGWRRQRLAATLTAAALTTLLAQAADIDAPALAPTEACVGLPTAEATLAVLNASRAGGADCGEAGAFLPAAPLAWNDRLAQIAVRQADAVALQHRLSHAIDGADLAARLHAARYEPARAAENLSSGPTTWDAVAAHWMASAAHCANVMTPQLREAGVGCAIGADQAGAPIRYWALVLGTPRATPRDAGQTLSASR